MHELVETESTPVHAFITQCDQVLCEGCWDARREDNIGDQDPNCWLFAKLPWNPAHHECGCCGTKDGEVAP